jgi:hypothetical protein
VYAATEFVVLPDRDRRGEYVVDAATRLLMMAARGGAGPARRFRLWQRARPRSAERGVDDSLFFLRKQAVDQ